LHSLRFDDSKYVVGKEGNRRKIAEYCQLPARTADRVLDKQTSILVEAQRLIDRSFLPHEQKKNYKALIEERNIKLS